MGQKAVVVEQKAAAQQKPVEAAEQDVVERRLAAVEQEVAEQVAEAARAALAAERQEEAVWPAVPVPADYIQEQQAAVRPSVWM